VSEDKETTQLKFLDDIRGRVDYFRMEFDLTYIEAIGALEIIKYELQIETSEDDEV